MGKAVDNYLATHGEPITEPETPEPTRLRKVPGKVHDADLQIITDAISLKRATVSYRSLTITDGAALTEICGDWLRAESARLSEKGGA